jgi:hypothetical protein
MAGLGMHTEYRILVIISLGKCSLERPERRWYDNIKMDLSDVGCKYGRWMEQAQDCVQYGLWYWWC